MAGDDGRHGSNLRSGRPVSKAGKARSPEPREQARRQPCYDSRAGTAMRHGHWPRVPTQPNQEAAGDSDGSSSIGKPNSLLKAAETVGPREYHMVAFHPKLTRNGNPNPKPPAGEEAKGMTYLMTTTSGRLPCSLIRAWLPSHHMSPSIDQTHMRWNHWNHTILAPRIILAKATIVVSINLIVHAKWSSRALHAWLDR